jgi:hypothetical protein
VNQPATLSTQQRQQQFQRSIISILASGAGAEFMIASLLFLVGGLSLGMTDTEELEWASLVAKPIPTYGASDWHGMLRQERLLALAYRAQYAEASLARLWVANQLGTFPHALALERGYFEKHLYAEWNRLRCAAAQDAVTPHLADGGLLSWHAVMDNRTTLECREANGKNFPADQMPVIGWPGAVHPYCRCSAGKPIPGAPLLPSV